MVERVVGDRLGLAHGVVGVAYIDVRRLDVGFLVGQSLVEGLVVAGIDPLLRWVYHLVAVVVAHLVGVECLFGSQGEFVEVSLAMAPMLPDGGYG